MPNWCYSTLEITGPKNEIRRIADTDLDFEKIYPTPTDLHPYTDDTFGLTEFQKQSNIAIHGHESWYEWRLQNWGTKWSAQINDIEKTDTVIRADMATPWSLPIEILKRLGKQNPNTVIHVVDCEEEAGFFVGSCKVQNGEIIQDDIHEPTKNELRKRNMPCEDDEDTDQ